MSKNTDPGTPSESAIKSFDFLRSQAENPESLVPPTPVKVEPDRPAPAPPVTSTPEEGLVFRKENDPIPKPLQRLDTLLQQEAEKSVTLIFEGVDIVLEYYEEHSNTITANDGTSMAIRRFLLPANTKVSIKPTQSLRIDLGDGVPIPVSFLGDMHDLDGILPFKMITFLEARPADS